MTEPEGSEADRLLDIELPHAFRGLDPEAVQALLTDAVGSLRESQRREDELRATITELEAALAEARSEPTAELEEAKRRGREMVTEAQTVRRRILEDLARRRRVLRRQIEQLRVGRERLLEAYEVVGHTVEEATQELSVALPAAHAAAERAGRLLGAEDQLGEGDVAALEAEIDAARAAGLPILDPPTAAERAAASASEAGGDIDVNIDGPGLVEVEPVVAAFEEVRVLGPSAPAPEAPRVASTGRVESDDAPPEASAVEAVAVEDTAVEDTAPPDDVGTPEGPEDPDGKVDVSPVVEEGTAEVLQLFDRIRAGDPQPEPETPGPSGPGAEPPRAAGPEPDPIETAPGEPAASEDPVAVLADDLARRLRRALADEQNQVLDRLRQDQRGQLGLDDLLGEVDARIVRLAMVIEPRLHDVVVETGSAASAADLAARLAAEVADGVRADIDLRVGPSGSAAGRNAVAGAKPTGATGTGSEVEPGDLARPVREAFRVWRTDRIVGLALGVAAEAVGPS